MSGIEEIRSVPLPLKPQYGEILIWTFWAKIREKDNGGGLALPGMSLAGCGVGEERAPAAAAVGSAVAQAAPGGGGGVFGAPAPPPRFLKRPKSQHF